MATLHSLPEHLVGQIYMLLPRDSQKAFYASTKAVSTAPSILHHHFSKLIISLKGKATINPLLTLPSKATLRHLVFDYSFSYGNPALPLSSIMLLPQFEEQRSKVLALFREVQVIEFKGSPDFKNEAAFQYMGQFLRTHAPSLHTIKLPKGGWPSAFLDALTASDGGRNIRHLEMYDSRREHLEALAKFRGLEFLRLSMARDIGCLKSVFAPLCQLKKLSLFPLPPADVVATLPASLETISFDNPSFGQCLSTDFCAVLVELLSCACSGLLPALQRIHIPKLCFWTTTYPWVFERILQELILCLSAATPAAVQVDEICFKGDPEEEQVSIHPMSWSICGVLTPSASKASFLGVRVTESDMAQLISHCPSVKDLQFGDACCYKGLSKCLSTVVEGLRFLERLDICYDPLWDPLEPSTYIPGSGLDVLSACALLSPSRTCVLKVMLRLHTHCDEASVDAACHELRSLHWAWDCIHRKLERMGGTSQQVVLESNLGELGHPSSEVSE
ncbi:hypothetical protein DUNSADRAFT_9918 [Dunaliella salina]|uniref:Uncharacterized protein n=1 Tax=Dunaliella salina TaxID=3046 RepID=A0ABQ7GGI6_DUNSA|nr:hypothetical protein DUNSADRAFT_9918 [Dunaliella salina]|eukprot:KAF5833720.1 hypothetical protein DUNSADRAFT_9918 [Dunaliella salina]